MPAASQPSGDIPLRDHPFRLPPGTLVRGRLPQGQVFTARTAGVPRSEEVEGRSLWVVRLLPYSVDFLVDMLVLPEPEPETLEWAGGMELHRPVG